MVCLEVEKPTRIAGGFVLVKVSWLMSAWRACRYAPLGVGDFRTLLACREMVARRCLVEGMAVTYDVPELAQLLGVAKKRARASLRRLEAAGLITWSVSAIGSPSAISFPEVVNPDLEQAVDTIGRGQGSIAVPRRILRLLAGGARPALIATTLGVLLRCLSRRRGGFEGRGRVKGSWIAQTFDVSIPAVKAARRELLALGWIEAEDSNQWAMNRWGRAFQIDLGWATPGSIPIPPRPRIGPISIPPCLHQEPLLKREENQEPARRGGPDGGTGVEIGEQGTQMLEPVAPHPIPSGIEPISEPPIARTPTPVELPAPTLGDVRIEDLKDNGRLFELLGQAIERKRIGSSEADRLKFVAAAEHTLAIGERNTPGLFTYLIRGGLWRYLTQEDEDRANARIKAHLRGPAAALGPRVFGSPFGPAVSEDAPRMGGLTSRVGVGEGNGPGSKPVGGPVRGQPSDAEIVKAARAAMIRARIFRDPFAEFAKLYPGWDRERWERALAAMNGPPRVLGRGLGRGGSAEN